MPASAGAPLPHVWEACIGSGRATLALRRMRNEDDLAVEVEIPAHAAVCLTIPGAGRAA